MKHANRIEGTAAAVVVAAAVAATHSADDLNIERLADRKVRQCESGGGSKKTGTFSNANRSTA